VDGQQHVLEAAQHLGPDGIGLQRAGEAQHRQLVHGHREVVGPEVHQVLHEGRRRAERAAGASADRTEVGLARVAPVRLPRGLLPTGSGLAHGALPRKQRLHRGWRALLGAPGGRQRVVALELGEQPALRVRGRRVLGTRAQAEAVQGDGGGAHGPHWTPAAGVCGVPAVSAV
jgi:hypothetical protein